MTYSRNSVGLSGATYYRQQSILKSGLYLQKNGRGVKYSWNDDAAVPDPINAGTMGFVATRVLLLCWDDV